MTSNDYILITSSRNLDDNSNNDDEVPEEKEDPSRRALERQGVFLDQSTSEAPAPEIPDDFSKQLQELGGIEIIPNEFTDTDY